ncbi:DUF6317 family protein [Nocardia sp. NPDC020380]|uniref:DUF6317 family protein n=1 Tax=Nocardia sp. NPDC020380 TaxID=3364309 RepID=UPI003797E05A
MTDFKVVSDDLTTMATAYTNEAGVYQKLLPKLSPALPDSGSAALNKVMRSLMDELDIFNQQMVSSIDADADKLRDARTIYDRTEDFNKNRFLWDNLNTGVN